MAAELNRVVGGWLGVRVTPMFGRFSYFVGEQLFGCYPIRPRAHDLWVRLSRFDQARALATSEARPHRRFAGRGWIECDVVGPEVVPQRPALAPPGVRARHPLAGRPGAGSP